VQLEPRRAGGGDPVDLTEGGQAVARVDRADREEETIRVLGQL
jgi:hypothetical protein